MATLALVGLCLIKYECCTLICWYALFAFLIRYYLSYIKIAVIYSSHVICTHGSRRHQVERVWEPECWIIWIITWQQCDEEVREKSTGGWLRYRKPFPREYGIKNSPRKAVKKRMLVKGPGERGYHSGPGVILSERLQAKSPLKIRKPLEVGQYKQLHCAIFG